MMRMQIVQNSFRKRKRFIIRVMHDNDYDESLHETGNGWVHIGLAVLIMID